MRQGPLLRRCLPPRRPAAQPDMLSLFSQPRQEDEPESHVIRETPPEEPDEPDVPTQLSLF